MSSLQYASRVICKIGISLRNICSLSADKFRRVTRASGLAKWFVGLNIKTQNCNNSVINKIIFTAGTNKYIKCIYDTAITDCSKRHYDTDYCRLLRPNTVAEPKTYKVNEECTNGVHGPAKWSCLRQTRQSRGDKRRNVAIWWILQRGLQAVVLTDIDDGRLMAKECNCGEQTL